MAKIDFKHDYGYAPASPFWLVLNENCEQVVKCETREEAEEKAARFAAGNAGWKFHIAAVVATVSTSATIVGERFDPTREPAKPTEDVPPPLPDPESPQPEAPHG